MRQIHTIFTGTIKREKLLCILGTPNRVDNVMGRAMRGVEFWDIRYFISYTSFRDNEGAPLITNFCHWPQQIISISNSSSFYWLASNFRLEIIYHNHCQGHHHQHLNHHHNHQHACPSLSLCVYLEWSTENYQLTP